MNNIRVWKAGERDVKIYMKKMGYKILYTNFSGVGFELDIVAILSKKVQIKLKKSEILAKIKDLNNKIEIKMLKMNFKNQVKLMEDLLVVTEVKSRSSAKFGLGVEAVDNEKIRHIKKGGNYLLSQPKFKNMQIRYDIASVDDGKIDYIENAF